MGAPRRAGRRRRRPHRRVRLRRRLSGLHRARGSSRTSTPGRSPCASSAELGPRQPRRRAGRGRGRRRGDRRAERLAATALARRLERFRDGGPGPVRRGDPLPRPAPRPARLAERLAAAIDGEVVATSGGIVVRVRGAGAIPLPVDRERLAALPGPAAGRTCRSSASTPRRPASRRRPGPSRSSSASAGGRATGSARSSCCCPTTPTSAALLDALGRAHPGRRLARHVQRPRLRLAAARRRATGWPAGRPPVHAGHLDLLPIVRRLFRHRMADARLRTVEAELLGLHRHRRRRRLGDPGRYLEFLRGGPADGRSPTVVRHNDEDVRSLARLLALARAGYADAGRRAGRARRATSPGWPARSPRAAPLDEALACLDAALDRTARRRPSRAVRARRRRAGCDRGRTRTVPWWSPRGRPDFGGRPPQAAIRPSDARGRPRSTRRGRAERIAVGPRPPAPPARSPRGGRRGLGGLARGPGRVAIVAWIELAKLREHRLARPPGALRGARRAGPRAIDRRRASACPSRRWRRTSSPARGAPAATSGRAARRRRVTPLSRPATSGTRGSAPRRPVAADPVEIGIERAGHRPTIAGQRVEVVGVVAMGRANGWYPSVTMTTSPSRTAQIASRGIGPPAGRRAGSPMPPAVGTGSGRPPRGRPRRACRRRRACAAASSTSCRTGVSTSTTSSRSAGNSGRDDVVDLAGRVAGATDLDADVLGSDDDRPGARHRRGRAAPGDRDRRRGAGPRSTGAPSVQGQVERRRQGVERRSAAVEHCRAPPLGLDDVAAGREHDGGLVARPAIAIAPPPTRARSRTRGSASRPARVDRHPAAASGRSRSLRWQVVRAARVGGSSASVTRGRRRGSG